MSYNIDSTTEIELKASMAVKDVIKTLREHEADLPEVNFLSEMEIHEGALPDDQIALPNW